MNQLDGDFVFVNKNAKSISLSSSKAGEKSWMDSHVRKRNAIRKKQSHQVHPQPLNTLNQTLRHRDELVFAAGQDHTSQSEELSQLKRKSSTRSRSVISNPELHACSCIDLEESAKVLATLSKIAAPLPMILSETRAHAGGHRSLAFFRRRTLLEAAGWADDYFWNTIALPLSDTQPTIFFALASLGSLHESLSSRDSSSKTAARNRSLELCNQAIQLTVAKDKDVPLVLLLPICVVFTTIQMFECVATAHANLRHGINLVAAARTQDAPMLSTTELDMLDTVEELFERYQCRLTLIMEPVSTLRQHRYIPSNAVEAPVIPFKFKNLYEARVYLERLNTWCYQLACTVYPDHDDLSYHIQPYHDRWLQAMSAFPHEEEHPLNYFATQRSIKLLKAARIASFILICTMNSNEQIVYDKYVGHFREIINLYEPCTACIKAKSRYQFTFGSDAGMIETLGLVASTCRESDIRQRAIDMLYKTARVEGAVTSRVAALIGAQWKAIEEEDLPTSMATPSMIPESRRVRLESLDFFTQVGMARLQFIRAPYVPGPDAGCVERWFKIREANSGNLKCFTDAAKIVKDLGPAETFRTYSVASNVTQGEKGMLPWPEAFTMKSSRLFFPIPRV